VNGLLSGQEETVLELWPSLNSIREGGWRDTPNLPAHKAAGVREAIEARGAKLLYLPKYSPDLNPIEMPFSALKAFLRKVAERTIPRLRRRIGSFAPRLTPREASNYFRHAGYV
jgi:hypothetical protein